MPLAQANLGVLLMNAGEPERARELLEAALASGNPQVVPLAQVNLGRLLIVAGEPERARELLEAALAWGGEPAGPGSARGPADQPGGLGGRGGRLSGGHQHRGSVLGAGRAA